MSARVVPKSVSMVAQTAPPTSVSVYPGRNRSFFLHRIGQGTSAGLVDPTLGGQAHDDTFLSSWGNTKMNSWFWDESSLQSAGIGINTAGSAAIAAFSETGITEYIWCWGTVENYAIEGRQVSLIPNADLERGVNKYRRAVARERNPNTANPQMLVRFVRP